MERGQAGPALFLHSAPAYESKFPYGTKLGLGGYQLSGPLGPPWARRCEKSPAVVLAAAGFSFRPGVTDAVRGVCPGILDYGLALRRVDECACER